MQSSPQQLQKIVMQKYIDSFNMAPLYYGKSIIRAICSSGIQEHDKQWQQKFPTLLISMILSQQVSSLEPDFCLYYPKAMVETARACVFELERLSRG